MKKLVILFLVVAALLFLAAAYRFVQVLPIPRAAVVTRNHRQAIYGPRLGPDRLFLFWRREAVLRVQR